jgi:hypothetical protein
LTFKLIVATLPLSSWNADLITRNAARRIPLGADRLSNRCDPRFDPVDRSRACTKMETTKHLVSFDEHESDLKQVLADMGILHLIKERLPDQAEQRKALDEILLALRVDLETLSRSPGNKTSLGHTSVRVGSYYFQFKKSLYVAATLAAGVTALAVLGPATAGLATAVALSPHIVGTLRGVNDVLVKLKPAEIGVYEAVAGVEFEKHTCSLTEEGANLTELRDWYKSRGKTVPKRLEEILGILVNERHALRSWVGKSEEVYYSVIP